MGEASDGCIYDYDLRDCWYYCLEAEEFIDPSSADGRVKLISGAMRCPD